MASSSPSPASPSAAAQPADMPAPSAPALAAPAPTAARPKPRGAKKARPRRRRGDDSGSGSDGGADDAASAGSRSDASSAPSSDEEWADDDEERPGSAAPAQAAKPRQDTLFAGSDAFPPMDQAGEAVSFDELNAGAGASGKGKAGVDGATGKKRSELSEEAKEKRRLKQKEARLKKKEKQAEERKQAKMTKMRENTEENALATAAEKLAIDPEAEGDWADAEPSTSAMTAGPATSTSDPAESSTSQHPAAMSVRGRGRGRGVPNFMVARQAYAERMAADPAFIPRVGVFWKHDARHYEDGAVGDSAQAGLRPMSEFWRGRGGPRGGPRGGMGMGMGGMGIRGRGRGRGGFGPGFGFGPGRGGHLHAVPRAGPAEVVERESESGERMTEMDREELRLARASERAREQRELLEQQAQAQAMLDEEAGEAVVPPPVVKPREKGRWGHEGYAEMAAGDDVRTRAVRGRGRGRAFAPRPMYTHLPTPEPSPDRLAPPSLPPSKHQPPRPFPSTGSPAVAVPREPQATETAADLLLGDKADVRVRLPGSSQGAPTPPVVAPTVPAPAAVTAPATTAQSTAQPAPAPPVPVEAAASARPTQLPNGVGVTPTGEYYSLASGPPGNFRPPVAARLPFYAGRPNHGPVPGANVPLHAPQAGPVGFGTPAAAGYPPQSFNTPPSAMPNGAPRPPANAFQPRPPYQQAYQPQFEPAASPAPFFPANNYFAPARTSKVSIRAPGAASPALSGAAGSDHASGGYGLHAQATGGQMSVYSHASHPSAGTGTPDYAAEAAAAAAAGYPDPAFAHAPQQAVNYSFFPDHGAYEQQQPGTVVHPPPHDAGMTGMGAGQPGAAYYGAQPYWPQQQGQWYYEEGYGY